jgi:hypothetical protein
MPYFSIGSLSNSRKSHYRQDDRATWEHDPRACRAKGWAGAARQYDTTPLTFAVQPRTAYAVESALGVPVKLTL